MYYIKKGNKNSLTFFLKEASLLTGNYRLKNMLIDLKTYFTFIILFEAHFIITLIVKIEISFFAFLEIESTLPVFSRRT